MTLVPTETSWRIAAWHLQQWTHKGKDAEAWVAEALDDSARQDKPTAYAKLDLAYKLLDGGKFVFSQLRNDIDATKNSILPGENAWMTAVKKTAPDGPIVYAGTYLAREGVGILVRLTLEKEENLATKEKICRDLAKKVYETPWTASLAGLHCDFTFANQPPNYRGVLGGVTIERMPSKPKA